MGDLLERVADIANNAGLAEDQQKTLHEAIGRIKVLESHYQAIAQGARERIVELDRLREQVENFSN